MLIASLPIAFVLFAAMCKSCATYSAMGKKTTVHKLMCLMQRIFFLPGKHPPTQIFNVENNEGLPKRYGIMVNEKGN